MHKVIQLILDFLYNKNMPLSMKIYVHYINLMKTKSYKNFKVFETLKGRVIRKRIHAFDNLTKKLC